MISDGVIIPDDERSVALAIRQNSRQSLVEIAQSNQLPVSRVFANLQRLRGKVIKRMFCDLDYAKIGFDLRICFFVKSDSRQNLIVAIENNTHINDMLRINNGSDYIIEAIFRDMHEVYTMLEILKSKSVEVKEYHVISILAKEKFLCK